MKVHLTEHAYERFMELDARSELDFASCLQRLQAEASGGDAGFFQWSGKPAVYLCGGYWCCDYAPDVDELTLLSCLGVLQPVSFAPRAALDNRREALSGKSDYRFVI